jgi:glycosyltransferase involved in cell wall biosynthesis
MRVLSIIETLMHGGAETVLVDLASRLTEHDHRVVHFSGSHRAVVQPWIERALRNAGVPLVDAPREACRTTEGRDAFLGGVAPDVVLYHWWGQDPLREWRADVGRAHARMPRFVAVLHRSGVPAPADFDAYVLVSPTQRPQVAQVEPARVHVIPNGVDLSRFPNLPRSADTSSFTIGRLSGLRSGKIPEDWIHTAVGFGLDRAHFVIAGDGPLRAALLSDAERLGATRAFAFPGYVPREDVPALLATFDVFCYVTSTAVECHPLALLEACAAGLPIVAQPRGGVLDIVTHEENGLLGESDREIGEHLRRLQRDSRLRERLADGARAMATRFAIERQIERYRDLLNLVVRPPATSRAPDSRAVLSDSAESRPTRTS